MKRTKVAQIYRKTGNLRAVQLLLGHTKMDSTVRYLGVELASHCMIEVVMRASRRVTRIADGEASAARVGFLVAL